MSDFLKDLITELGSDFASIASDGIGAAANAGYVDTGCYMFNAALSGSIYGGLPKNKITGLAGDPATGKSFFALSIVKNFLDTNKKSQVVYFDTEAAITKEMLEERNIDSKRILIVEPDTIQNFRHKALKIINAYEQQKEEKQFPLLFVLDSLGMLSTTKEMEDSSEGKETKDMTKAATIKAAFRVLTLRLAKAKITMIVTNHVYAAVGCLSGKQEILLVNSKTKQISEIKINDEVTTLIGPKLVSNIFKYDINEILEIELESGKKIECTKDHKFLLKTLDWKKAEELKETDIILSVF